MPEFSGTRTRVEQLVGGSSELTVSATPSSDSYTHTLANTYTSSNAHPDRITHSHSHNGSNSHSRTHTDSWSDPHACSNTHRDVAPVAHANHHARTGVDPKQNGCANPAKPSACALIGPSAHTHAITDGGASEYSDAGARSGLRGHPATHANSDDYRAVHSIHSITRATDSARRAE